MMFKKEKDLEQLKQALQKKTESCEKTKYSLERLTEESLEKDISKIQEEINAFER